MSKQNVEIVRRMLDAFHRGDAEGSLACFDDEIVFDASRRVDGGIAHGHRELSRSLAEWLGAWEEWREEIDDIRDLGDDRVYMAATQRGRGKGSGLEIENRYALIYEIEGDKITRMTLYTDPADAVEDAGPSE